MRLAPYFSQAAEKFPRIDLHAEIRLKTQPASSASTHLFLNAIQPWENAAAITGSRSVSSMFDKLVRAIRCAFFRDCRDIAHWEIRCEIAERLGADIEAVEKFIHSGFAFARLAADYQRSLHNADRRQSKLATKSGPPKALRECRVS
jgi:hypothetical protein